NSGGRQSVGANPDRPRPRPRFRGRDGLCDGHRGPFRYFDSARPDCRSRDGRGPEPCRRGTVERKGLMSIFSKFDDIRAAYDALDKNGRNPFDIRFEKIVSPTEAVLDGRRILLFGTNNYLGLTFDQSCVDASIDAIR